MNDSVFLMDARAFTKREERRQGVETSLGALDVAHKMRADDLEDQYKRVFSVSGRTAKIVISGPLSPDGPDWVDVYLGYGGTAYKNISRAANEAVELKERGDIDDVIVRMNTPGGTLDGVDQAYLDLTKIRDFAVVKNDGLVASAGVWLASAVERIEPSTDSARIGSIGVVQAMPDLGWLATNFGVVYTTNTEGANKLPDVSTQDGVEATRRELDGIYDVFVARVTASRPISRATIDSLKGEIVIAARAIDLGLMDEPRTGDVPEAEKNQEQMEENVDKGTKEAVSTEHKQPDVEAAVNVAIEAERKRLSNLAAIAGLDLSGDLKEAIETGVDAGEFAVKQAEAKRAEEKAEIDAARKLRDQNPDQEAPAAGDGKNVSGLENEGKDAYVQKVQPAISEYAKRLKGGK